MADRTVNNPTGETDNREIKMKKLALLIILLCTLSTQALAAEQVLEKDHAEGTERILDISSTTFFNYLPGTFYIYFGQPESPDCVVFEERLDEFLRDSHWVVYYFNMDYWKEDSQYRNILNKYGVENVPALVKTIDRELADTFLFDETWNEEETAEALDAFFGEKTSGLFPTTTADNYPIQFSDNLHAFTFLLMLADVLFLCFRRKEILEKQLKSLLLFLVITATVLFAFHWVIAGFGFSFAIHYNANPDTGRIAQVGKYTFLTVTPVLYAAVLILAAKLRLELSGQAREKDRIA